MELRFKATVDDQNVRESPQRGHYAVTTLSTTTVVKPSNPSSASNKVKISKCRPIERNGMMWPETRAGDIAQKECFDGTRGSATWRCVKLGSELHAEWAKEGPNMPDCISWINEIAANFYRGNSDLDFTMETLQQESSLRFPEISRKQLKILIQFTKNLLQNAMPINKTSASRVVRATVATMSIIIENKGVWDSIDAETKASMTNDIMVTTEAAANLFINGPGKTRRIENTRVSTENILFQAQSWERAPWDANFELKTTFPDNDFCSATDQQRCLADVVTLPDMTIAREKSKAGLIYTIYRGMGRLLDDSNQLDSSIAIVSSISSKYPTSTSPPEVQLSLRHIAKLYGTRHCAKWTYSDATKHWSWSNEGCTVISSNISLTTCKCNGYGKYAIVRDPAYSEPYSIEPKNSQTNKEALAIITSAGIAVAIISFLACATTLLVLRDLTGDLFTIRKNICICTLIAEITFLVGINQTGSQFGCAFVAGLLQYFLLAIFTWTILEAAQLCKMLMDMFDEESRWKVYYTAGYGVPTVVVAVSVGIGFKDYGTSNACFINPSSGIMFLLIISTLSAIVATVGVLCGAIYKICTSSVTFTSCRMTSEIKTSVKKSFTILFLQLMTWIVAISWINERSTFLAILFCLCNTALGMGTFICYCVLSKQIRRHYKNLFERIGCSETYSKDSYLEKSSTFQRSYTPARYPAIDANNDTTTGSLERQPQSPWEITYPRTVLSSPETEVMTTFDTRDHATLGQRLARTNTQQMYTHHRLTNSDQQTTLLSHDCDIIRRNRNDTGSNTTPYKDRHMHRHSECFHQVRGLENDNSIHHKRYKTGLPVAPRRHHQKCRTMGQYPTNTNPNRVPKPNSRPILGNRELHKFMDIDDDHVASPLRHQPYFSHDVTLSQDGVMYARSTNHQLPPNSIIHRLRNEMLPPDDRARFIPVTDYPATQPTSSRRNGHIKNENNTSEDEGQGSSVEESEHNVNSNGPSYVTRQATFESQQLQFSSHRNKFRRQQAVVTSDHDDAIVTDYSGDGNESPVARHYAQWSNQELLV